jgi:hypothetical protein
MTTYAEHVEDFEKHRRLRAELVESWPLTDPLDPAVVRSIQRFQLGEDGDGATLLANSAKAGDPDYLAAVRLFEAEEQNHARLLRNVLACAGEGTISRHWTETVFAGVRRAMGLRLELMTLMLAEVVALRYYRALRDGTSNRLLTDVAGGILADERRHVPFHVDRLRAGFARTPALGRRAGAAFWWFLMTGTTLVVAVDHGPAPAPPGRLAPPVRPRCPAAVPAVGPRCLRHPAEAMVRPGGRCRPCSGGRGQPLKRPERQRRSGRRCRERRGA